MQIGNIRMSCPIGHIPDTEEASGPYYQRLLPMLPDQIKHTWILKSELMARCLRGKLP